MFTFKVVLFSLILTILGYLTFPIAVVLFCIFIIAAFYHYVVRPFRKIKYHYWYHKTSNGQAWFPDPTLPRLDR